MDMLLQLFALLSTFQLPIKMQMVTLIEHRGVLTAEHSYCVCIGK